MTTATRPHCKVCGLRIELTARPGWAHLRTAAGIEADDDHLAEAGHEHTWEDHPFAPKRICLACGRVEMRGKP